MREKRLAFVFASVSGVRAVFPLPEIQMMPSGTFYIGSIVLKNRVGGSVSVLIPKIADFVNSSSVACSTIEVVSIVGSTSNHNIIYYRITYCSVVSLVGSTSNHNIYAVSRCKTNHYIESDYIKWPCGTLLCYKNLKKIPIEAASHAVFSLLHPKCLRYQSIACRSRSIY